MQRGPASSGGPVMGPIWRAALGAVLAHSSAAMRVAAAPQEPPASLLQALPPYAQVQPNGQAQPFNQVFSPEEPRGFQAFASAVQVGALPEMKPKGMLTMRALRIASTPEEGSKIYLGAQGELSLGTDKSSSFVVREKSVATPILELDAQDTLHLGSQRVQAQTVDAGTLSINGVKQWQLVRSEDFSQRGEGWSRWQVTQCAGISMLGGYCRLSRGEVNKTFTGLPPHKQLRVVATFHFIDRWIGEAGYMKLSVGPNNAPTVVWSEQHAEEMSRNGISLCGRSQTPEGKFSSPIDVTVPHQQDSIQVSFGSTMEDSDPCDESWGVSGVEIYTRN